MIRPGLARASLTAGILLSAACSRGEKVEPLPAESRAAASSAPSGSATPSAAGSTPTVEIDPPVATSWPEQRAQLYESMRAHLGLDDRALAQVKEIVDGSPLLGQGRPDDTVHPMTRAECRTIRASSTVVPAEPRCGRPNMVPVYDPARGETRETASLCIDQFEFPNIPCEYPVTYASAREAALLCDAVGERLCDAHEWEGACAGALHPAESEYHFEAPRPYATWLRNREREIVWAYGPNADPALCAESGQRSDKCDSSGLVHCGSNTWPAGAFPKCVSPFGVYDQHGNVAEHMSLPLEPAQLGARGGSGQTEMKGSWFASGRTILYEDDCRWRAKDWHPSTVLMLGSHRNYHLGFRCCRDVSR